MDYQTKLIEIKNKEQEILRGLLIENKQASKIVICIHGFEASGIAEKKFKIFSDELIKNNIASLRFDFSACGASDGNFEDVSVEKQTQEFARILATIKEKYQDISVCAHSLGTCVLASFLKNNPNSDFRKIILMAPALNQKVIIEYLYVLKTNPSNPDINWHNYHDFFNKTEFSKEIQQKTLTTKRNYIPQKYLLENMDKNYSDIFKKLKLKNILHIHGDQDKTAPLQILDYKFPNCIIVKKGDHHLERPDMMRQWLKPALSFIIN
ncbi:alpha/beta hydrolase [Candidatus Beckwithbacteria bacterium]|nr:alpha/beta hydrolase [Candidatus Beckwithbacteria bacterium]